jgi:outer membrane receptor protein involved in Fe transport
MLGYRGDTFSADAALQVFNTKTALVELASFDPATGQYTRYGSRLNPDQHATIESTRLTYGFETDLVSGPDFNLQLRARGLVQDATSDLQVQTPLAYDFFGSGTFAINAAGHSEQTQYSNYADLFAEFSTAGIQHKAIVAVDVSEQQTQTQTTPLGFVNTTGDTFPLNPIDLSVPASHVNEQQYGVVVQDQMTLGDWHVLLGLRQSWYRNSTQTAQDPNSRIVVPADAFLPSVGVVYDVLPELSVYASYREGFVPLSPQSYPTFDNRPLLPSLQTRYEVGFKSGLFDDRLTLNGSYYEYETENEGVIDLANSIPPNTFYENGPGSKGEGYELSVAGSITPSFKILAGYAHQEIKRVDGNIVTGRPEDIANIWAIKTFDLSGDMTLDLGFGANYNSGSSAFSVTASALAGAPVFFDLDREFLAFRATAGLRFDDTRINLSIDNLFDRENYEPVDSIDAVPLAPPRVVRLVLSQAF